MNKYKIKYLIGYSDTVYSVADIEATTAVKAGQELRRQAGELGTDVGIISIELALDPITVLAFGLQG